MPADGRWDLIWRLEGNPLNVKLNPICHLLALLAAHPILHVSRIRVKGRGSFRGSSVRYVVVTPTDWPIIISITILKIHKINYHQYEPSVNFVCSSCVACEVNHNGKTVYVRPA